ncbi:MAG TPA: ABC transporter ATP-binding protein [Sphingomonadaceae bacterium]|nr:ABC transporter ATP-binding protein [Sphingomonadaceae bacterium]
MFAIDKKNRSDRADQLIEMVGLNSARSRAVGEFSKGMQRRIGLAQALINDPDLIILDEPTSGLDPIGCREVKDLILELARRGKTVILSSHLLSDVEDVCDRAVIYYGGKIQANGTLKELLSERDSIRITSPTLNRETMDKVLAIIRAEVDMDRVRIDNPTQNLENYFLDVVRRAKEASTETSGATSGNRVAAYLRSDDTSAQDPSRKVLERLTSAAQPAEAAKPAPAKEEAKPKVDQARLGALSQAQTPKPEPRPEAKPAEQPKKDLGKANEKLSSLLGGKKDSEK